MTNHCSAKKWPPCNKIFHIAKQNLLSLIVFFCFCSYREGCMCLLCWITLQQEHRFSLECLLKPSASPGSMVRKMRKSNEKRNHFIFFLTSKADSLLRAWREIGWSEYCVCPKTTYLLLDERKFIFTYSFGLCRSACKICTGSY